MESGLKRPDGFTVEDLCTDVMKTSARKRTYKREFNPFQYSSGPLAIYESNVGDAALNISPVDLIAEHMISRYGDKLNGKRLIVRQFSLTIKETVDTPQGIIAIPLGVAAIGTAIVTTIAATAAIRATGPGRSLRLAVKIDAELDGKSFEGFDFGSIIVGTLDERPAKIVNTAFELGFYKFEFPEKRMDDPTPREQERVNDASP